MSGETQPVLKLSLLQKLVKVYEQVDHIEKRGRNDKQNYSFVRSADVLHATRNALAEFGIYAQTNFELLGTYDIKTNSGGNMHTATVRCTIVLYDAETGEELSVSGLGDGADSGDKGIYKAQTGAIKNTLRNAFLVPDAADPEADDSVDVHTSQISVERKTTKSTPKQVSAAPAQEMGSRPQAASKELQPPNQQTVTATVQPAKAQIPNATPAVPSTTEVSPQPTASAPPMIALPNEAEMTAFRQMFAALDNNLTAAGLKPSRGLRTGHKIRNYILKTVGVVTTDLVTKAQWETFFQLMAQVMSTPEGTQQLIQMIESPEVK